MNVKKYIGIPYLLGGRDLSGLDCYGLVWLALADLFGIQAPTYDGLDVSDRHRAAVAIKDGMSDWQVVPKCGMVAGDVALFNIAGNPWHVGLIVGNNDMLHVLPKKTSTVEKINCPRWKNRMVGVYRYGS